MHMTESLLNICYFLEKWQKKKHNKKNFKRKHTQKNNFPNAEV